MFSEENVSKRSLHGYSKAWIFNSILGLIGAFLNSYVLHIFVRKCRIAENLKKLSCNFSERKSMITSVNAMIWYMLI